MGSHLRVPLVYNAPKTKHVDSFSKRTHNNPFAGRGKSTSSYLETPGSDTNDVFFEVPNLVQRV